MTTMRGLSEAEVLERRKRGQGNDVRLPTSRSYRHILKENVFAFINIVLFSIGVVLLALGRVNDAIVSVGIITMNILIGVFQEVRAKRKLDRIALLKRPKVTLLRDNQENSVDPSEIVLGDIIRVQQGDMIVVDGIVIGEGKIEIDESLLTGESDLILKQEGDQLLSGSYCVSGSALQEATRVGAESYANQLAIQARSFRVVHTPLQKDVDHIIRIATALAMFLGLLFLISAVLNAIPIVRSAQMAAVITGLVPNGLFLMVVVAYAMGALKIVGYGALVQQANSIESLSNVNVLCMDKTGTLTANRIHYFDLKPIGMERKTLEAILGDYAKSASVVNRTGEALLAAFGGENRPLIDEVPFSSERKWSAVAFNDDNRRGAYVLGAVEVLQPNLETSFSPGMLTEEWTQSGLRVLLFAHQPEVLDLHDVDRYPLLPQKLIPLGLLSFSDELRPALKETLIGFVNAGIELKVISGDDPQTVGSLAKQAGLPGDLEALVSGFELDKMDEGTFEKVVDETTIFGRVRPSQKERLVGALRGQGHYVAMIGDGVNDVLSLKAAHLGIAMESGSSATRSVADMVLLNDSFGALPPAFLEGQRIFNGMKDILRLFLTRAFYFGFLIIATAVIGIGFPYVPTHATLVMFLSVAVPTFALAVWARPGRSPRKRLIPEVMRFALPAAFSTALFGILIYALVFSLAVSQNEAGPLSLPPGEIEILRSSLETADTDLSESDLASEASTLAAQTALTVFTTLAGLILVLFVEPPTRFFVGGDVFSGDWRPTFLVIGMLVVFLIVLLVKPLRDFFELLILSWETYLLIIASVILWTLFIRGMWRGRWLERFLRFEQTV